MTFKSPSEHTVEGAHNAMEVQLHHTEKDFFKAEKKGVYLGLSPIPVTVTTRIITFLVGDPYKHSFATVTGRGDNPRCIMFGGTCFVLFFKDAGDDKYI